MHILHYNIKFEDSEFGTVYVRFDTRCRGFRSEFDNDRLLIRAPQKYEVDFFVQLVNSNREQLRDLRERTKKMQSQAKAKRKNIDFDFCVDADHFSFTIVADNTTISLKRTLDNNTLPNKVSYVLHLPESIDCEEPSKQRWLQTVFENALVEAADRILLNIISELSQKSGLIFESFKCGHALSRWGSCNRLSRMPKSYKPDRGFAVVDLGEPTQEETYAHNIILSAYLMLMPDDLIKSVILHELTHTRYMDHSPAFHQTVDTLDRAILGKSEAECERELNSFQLPFHKL